MVKVQEYISNKYQTKEDKEKEESLDVSSKKLEGELDLREFVNLKKLNCSDNYLTSLNLEGLKNLEILNCDTNDLTEFNYSFLNPDKLVELDIRDNKFVKQDLSEFGRFTKLKILFIGNSKKERIDNGFYNQFYGSLEHLKNLTELERLHILNTDISSGLEYLSKSLVYIYCVSRERESAEVRKVAKELKNFERKKNQYNIKEYKEERIKNLEKVKVELIEKLDELQITIDQFKEDLENSQNKNKYLEKNLEKERNLFESKEKDIGELEKEKFELLKERESFEKEQKETIQKNRELEENKLFLEKEIENLEIEVEALEKTISNLKERIRKANESNTNDKKEMEELEQELSVCINESVKSKSSLIMKKKELEIKIKEIKELKTKQGSLVEEFAKLEIQLSEAVREKGKYKSNADSWKGKNEILESKNLELQKKINKLMIEGVQNEKFDELSSDLFAYSSLEKELERAKNKETEIGKKIVERKDEVKDLESKGGVDNKYTRLLAEISRLQKELEEAKVEVARLETEIKNLKEKINNSCLVLQKNIKSKEKESELEKKNLIEDNENWNSDGTLKEYWYKKWSKKGKKEEEILNTKKKCLENILRVQFEITKHNSDTAIKEKKRLLKKAPKVRNKLENLCQLQHELIQLKMKLKGIGKAIQVFIGGDVIQSMVGVENVTMEDFSPVMREPLVAEQQHVRNNARI